MDDLTTEEIEYLKREPLVQQAIYERRLSTRVDQLLEALVNTVQELYPGNYFHQYIEGLLHNRYPQEPRPVNNNGRIALKPGERRQIFERDAYRCCNCESYKDLVIDHIEPVSQGGTNAQENLQTLCRRCNTIKRTHAIPFQQKMKK